MNRKLQFLLYFIFFVGCSKIVDEDALTEKSSIKYSKGSSSPFTGEVIGKYDSGQERVKGKYIDGKRDGMWTFLYKNGKESKTLEVESTLDTKRGMMIKKIIPGVP